jgi:hypothetical protein
MVFEDLELTDQEVIELEGLQSGIVPDSFTDNQIRFLESHEELVSNEEMSQVKDMTKDVPVSKEDLKKF